MVTTDQIKELRDQTGISIMQCKKALEEAGGDKEKALVMLRKQGASVAEKKGERNLGSSAISAYIHAGGKVGAMVELSSETDFVSKNEEFQKLAYELAMQVAATSPKYLKTEEITDEEKEKAKEVFLKEVEGKPEDLKEKILSGKLDAHFKESILLEQPYIKNPDQKIADLIQEAIQKFGENIEIARFVRFGA